jgi:hypothetical protein
MGVVDNMVEERHSWLITTARDSNVFRGNDLEDVVGVTGGFVELLVKLNDEVKGPEGGCPAGAGPCRVTPAMQEDTGIMRRNRALMVIGVVIFLAAWLAWKVLHTASRIPTPVPLTQGNDR